MITKLLLYCTKGKKQLVKWEKYMYGENRKNDKFNSLNGKIIGECDFEVSKVELHQAYYNYEPAYFTKRENPFKYFPYTDLLSASCMQDNEMLKYLSYKGGYAIHIKHLHIFDEPKELNEVYSIHNVGGMLLTDKLKKAPQNMQRISLKEWEYGTYNPNDIAILISIHPEWLCKILNGEKTIEIRKKVLKEML